MKSKKNKTIDFTLEDGIEYFNKAIEIDHKVALSKVENKTIWGDSFEILDYLPDSCIDLLIVDPPYNLTKNYDNLYYRKKGKQEYREYTLRWLNKVDRLLKSESSIYVCCDWKSSLIIEDCLEEKYLIKNRITWQREKGRGSKDNWKNSMEDIWYATKSNQCTFNIDKVKIRRKVLAPYREKGSPKDWIEDDKIKYRDTHPSNFWDDITIPFWSMEENTAHPTQKSEKLIAKLILASSNEDDLILDPFLGSGTTSVVAKKLNRRYIGIEQSKQYVAWAEKRLFDAESNKKIQGYDGVFWERNSKINRRKK